MSKPGDTLIQLRGAIDDIDDRIHDLLMARADLAGQIRTAKQQASASEGGDMGSAYRPAREADMLRRLKARHRGALPFESVARIWREIIASLTQLQSPYGLYICGGADLMAFHDIGRFYYGAKARIKVLDDAAAVAAAAAADPHGLGLVPFPQADAQPWWVEVLDRLDHGVAVIAALPFFRNLPLENDNPSILVLSHAPFEPSGDDTSLIAIACSDTVDDTQLTDLLGAQGVAALILDRSPARPNQPETGLRLVRLGGYLADKDDLRHRLRQQAPGQITDLKLLGGYANPIREGLTS